MAARLILTHKRLRLLCGSGAASQRNNTHDIFYDRWWNCKAAVATHDKTFTFHVTRHTCASNLAITGKNQELIGEILLHSSEKTTAKYVGPHDEAKKAAMSDLSIDI